MRRTAFLSTSFIDDNSNPPLYFGSRGSSVRIRPPRYPNYPHLLSNSPVKSFVDERFGSAFSSLFQAQAFHLEPDKNRTVAAFTWAGALGATRLSVQGHSHLVQRRTNGRPILPPAFKQRVSNGGMAVARIRNVKPDFFDDTKLASVSLEARYLFIGLFCWFDRQGVMEADVKFIKHRVFPYDSQITEEQVNGWLAELVELDRVRRLKYEGKWYLYCPNFSKHQKFHRDEKAKYPVPLDILKKHPASSLQAPCLHPASSAEIGNRRTETESPTAASDHLDPLPSPTNIPEIIEELSDFPEPEVLSLLTPEGQRFYLKRFGHTKIFRRELLECHLHWLTKKEPRPEFVNTLKNWFRVWEERTQKENPVSLKPLSQKVGDA